MQSEDTIDDSFTHTTYIEGTAEVVGLALPDQPLPTIEPTSLTYRITEKPKPPETPLLNRAQRRQLGRYIRHKAALQMRHVWSKNDQARWAYMARQDSRCSQCSLWPLPAPVGYRCQCKVAKHRVEVVS